MKTSKYDFAGYVPVWQYIRTTESASFASPATAWITDGETTLFYWNGNHIIAEMTDSFTNFYTWANGETLTASLDGETVFYCHDANKNITDLVDDSGTHLVHYDYSPFGVQSFTLYTSPFTVSLNPFGFSNEYWDSTTSLVEYKYRKYYPSLAKFLSLDPIGVQGGLNEYAICGNDLINWVDWWGLSDGVSIYVGFGPAGPNKGFEDIANMVLTLGTVIEDKDCKPTCKIKVGWRISSKDLTSAIMDYDHSFLFAHALLYKRYREDENGNDIIRKQPGEDNHFESLHVRSTKVFFSNSTHDLAEVLQKPEYDMIVKQNAKISNPYDKKTLPGVYVKAQKTFYPYVCYDNEVLDGQDEYLGINIERPFSRNTPNKTSLLGMKMLLKIKGVLKNNKCKEIELIDQVNRKRIVRFDEGKL
ncbi:MAG: RHS repeat-associated core domain-containing protein [Kiritimatiellae bacterium]|nr:RHS repeat-associated core domain-containing protein [Kiritimatiellia bacterium]